ncbi:hypothetical protein EYV94_14030 [Puteibacter caeruleilacunae]|nr:hypothetical protein EYV94_14030 [Puteibacter caeruleilacunae]
MKKDIFCVILDYCGGLETDNLYEKLSAWNPEYNIEILDNASPENKSRNISITSSANSGIGGGIKDCINQCKSRGSRYLLFITNDIVPITKIDFELMANVMMYNDGVALVSPSLSLDSDKPYYPWMTCQKKGENRVVPHADFLCCLFDTQIIDSFGGFPDSRSGWGYDWEFAYHSRSQNKRMVVCDSMIIKHLEENLNPIIEMQKQIELKRIYDQRYGDYRKLRPHRYRVIDA